MQASLRVKLSFLLTILMAAALVNVWPGPTRGSSYFRAPMEKCSSSCLVFMMLNLVAAAIFFSNSSDQGAATIDDDKQDEGDFHACTPLVLVKIQKQLDQMMHVDNSTDGGCVHDDDNGDYDDENDENDSDGDDDDDNIDPIDLQKRSQEFIDKIIKSWQDEKLRDGLMHPP